MDHFLNIQCSLKRKSTMLAFFQSTTVRVWTQAKWYTKAYCNYTIHSLHKNINPALNSVPLQSIQKHFQKVRHYMFAYLEGIPGGTDLEKLVKK